ncbi:hypothetical protein SAMN04488115_112147 [Bosea lathyri]|uniref:Uncharacterized protein n=1 Tax=Bosea lathyri TaxID=1036778 RepID=A0A1H6CVQ0_9HYPH|nr:hypothetical protein SAMN04488115_112147 [Bosea lathyri]
MRRDLPFSWFPPCTIVSAVAWKAKARLTTATLPLCVGKLDDSGFLASIGWGASLIETEGVDLVLALCLLRPVATLDRPLLALRESAGFFRRDGRRRSFFVRD